ncbi:hypothetical protein [Herbaspirillum sp. C9C3]|uniref:hypothetical protein n=1 Tax=Herbaspirillum sp. C9C3 TaxID=2735271 RepID=UPI00158456C5|nr:hypothetical protein [Herbaspirillum sp. C9C3]NUT60140.1 hypothetical protein [Herbaspirillum sp. C9C3]
MRQTSKKTQYFDAQPSWKQIHFQNAIISAILNGHFQTEAGGVRRSVDDLPIYLTEIGRRKGIDVIRPFGDISEKDAKYLTKVFDTAIRDSGWLDLREGRPTMPSGLALKRYLLETRISTGKFRVKWRKSSKSGVRVQAQSTSLHTGVS